MSLLLLIFNTYISDRYSFFACAWWSVPINLIPIYVKWPLSVILSNVILRL